MLIATASSGLAENAGQTDGLWQEMRERARLLRRANGPGVEVPSKDITAAPNDADGADALPVSIVPPKFSRVVIEANGGAQFQGLGTPGSEVTVSAGGSPVARATVARTGRWDMSVASRLAPGEYRITTSARGKSGQAVSGQDIRIRVPVNYTERIVVIYDGSDDDGDPVRRNAGDLANAATRAFDGALKSTKPRESGSRPVTENAQAPARPAGMSQLEEAARTAGDRVQDWLAKANRTYQRDIARRLSVPADGKPEEKIAKTGADKPRADDRTAVEAETEKRRREDAEWDRLEAEARAKAAADAKAKEQAETAAKEKAEAMAAAAARESEAKERAEAARREAEARAEDQRRLAELARKDLAARKLEEARQQEEAKRQEEARKQEEVRKAEETKRLALEAEKAKKTTAADEKKKMEEAKRVAEDAARKEAERKRLAEEAEKDARERAANEAKARAEAELQKREEERQAQQEEVEQLASDLERRTERPVKVEPARPARAEEETEPAAEQPPAEQPAKVTKTSKKDPRPSEGSAEEPAPGDPGLSEALAAQGRPRICRLGRNKRERHHLSYVVRPGDTLWSISERFLGRGELFELIYRANEEQIENPDFLVDCQRIVVPLKTKRRHRH